MRASLHTLFCSSAILLLPATAAAQQASVGATDVYRLERLDRPRWLDGSGMLAVNALLGGVGTGIVSELRGRSFLRGFVAGAAAGGAVYAGKVVAAQRFSGAGLLGRQLAGAGGSVAANVARGEPALARLELPLGPARLLVDTRNGHVSARFDPLGAVVLAYAVASPDFRLDPDASLSAGTPVFRTDSPVLTVPVSGATAAALELYSVILLGGTDQYASADAADIFAHERIHTVQADAFQAFWGRALLEWASPSSPGWQKAAGILDVNLGKATAELLDHLLWRRGLWEIEADYIGRN